VLEERLRALLDSMDGQAVCTVDPTGVVTSWNIGAERLFGHTAADILGRPFDLLYAGTDREQGAPAADLAAAEAQGRLALERVRRRRAGELFPAYTVLAPVRDASGHLQEFSLVISDLTERKRLEEDLRRRAEDLAVANRAKEDFLATLSHELRTPLNAMLGWTRLLRLGKLDDAGISRALETIERNAHVQAQLISDILDVSRIVAGSLPLDLQPTDLAPVVEATVGTLGEAAEAKGIALRSRVEVDGAVLGDPPRLRQALANLVDNAIKFTAAGGSILVTLDLQGTSAAVTVSDTGEGIPPDVLPYVFDRFRQGDASVTRRHGGLGLGLSIARHIVEQHGGQLTVRSGGRGEGATFSVTIPIRAIRRLEGSGAPASPALGGMRVLVVDDQRDARDVVSRALSGYGARTAAAGSVSEALRLLMEFDPHVLVSDICMPGEDGLALIRRIRALGENGRKLPAVALTGLGQPEDRHRALDAGFQRYLAKPVEVDELAAVIRQVADAA
jgi:PAS domain S-box-containing protein